MIIIRLIIAMIKIIQEIPMIIIRMIIMALALTSSNNHHHRVMFLRMILPNHRLTPPRTDQKIAASHLPARLPKERTNQNQSQVPSTKDSALRFCRFLFCPTLSTRQPKANDLLSPAIKRPDQWLINFHVQRMCCLPFLKRRIPQARSCARQNLSFL